MILLFLFTLSIIIFPHINWYILSISLIKFPIVVFRTYPLIIRLLLRLLLFLSHQPVISILIYLWLLLYHILLLYLYVTWTTLLLRITYIFIINIHFSVLLIFIIYCQWIRLIYFQQSIFHKILSPLYPLLNLPLLIFISINILLMLVSLLQFLLLLLLY